MTGKITVILLVVITLIFGVVFFYFQTYAYYSKVNAKEQIIVNKIQIKVEDYIGIRSDVSKLKLRGCFNIDPSAFEFFETSIKASPLSAPFWFECFDYKEIQSDIDNGTLKAYLAEENEYPGIDRYVAISINGIGYEWRQLNEKYEK
jgi:hypothetical protein